MPNVTVRLQVSDYNPTEQGLHASVQNDSVNAPIKVEEIVMGMIKDSTGPQL